MYPPNFKLILKIVRIKLNFYIKYVFNTNARFKKNNM
jgi:hypothetical protein